MQGFIYCGTLEHWVGTSLYASFLCSSLRTLVNHSIYSCRQNFIDSKQIKYLFVISKEFFSIDEISQNQRCMQRKIAKEMYSCQYLTHENKDMRNELRFLHEIFVNKKTYIMQTPISHLIDRRPSCTTFGDAYLEVCGGFLHKSQF